MASLVFGGASSDRVNCGSAASLDDLTTFSGLVWVFCTTRTNGRRIWSKGNTAANGFRLSGSTGNVQLLIVQATTNLSYITNDTPLATDTWKCFAFTYDQGATPRAHIYNGGLTTILVESAYGTSDDGSGNKSADNTLDFVWGNSSAASPNTAFQGNMAVGMFWNRTLSLGELKDAQFFPHNTAGCVNLMRFGFNGTGTQPDYSGNANAGTVTGATAGNGVPLGPAWRRHGGWRGAFTAAAGAAVAPWHHYQQMMAG